MKTSTNRGLSRTSQDLARLAETDLFRRFQYLTVPLGTTVGVLDRARTATE
jgi:hypothetical protein